MLYREARQERWRTIGYAAWAVIGVVAILYGAGWVLGRVAGALAPFVVAFLFVFTLQGPVSAFERRGLSRAWATLSCFAIGLLIITIAVVFIAPALGHQIVEFANAVPDIVSRGEDLLTDAQQRFSAVVIPDWLRTVALSAAQAASQVFVRLGNAIAQGVVAAGGGIATVFFDIVLGVVISFWTLKDLPKIRRELRTLAGDKYEDDLENLLATVGRVVGGYLKGQTVASLSTGALAGIGLAIVGVPYALALAIITFVSNYIPYVGPFISGAVAAVVALVTREPWQALAAIAVVVVAQNLVDTLITPRVMSEQVDLHPTLVIFSLLVGGSLFGFWGMIFAIPVAATAKGLFVYYWERRTSRPLATEDGALFRTPSCDEDEDPCEPGETAGDEHGSSSEDTGSE